MNDTIIAHVVETVAGAASMAAQSMLQTDKPLAYATLRDGDGVTFGVVIVAIVEEEADALLTHIHSRGGHVLIGEPA